MTQDSLIELDDLLSPSYFADPYTLFEQLQKHDPVHWNAMFGFWLLTSYDDVVSALQDHRFTNTFVPFDSLVSTLSPEDLAVLPSVASYISMFMQGMDPHCTRVNAG